MILSPWLLILKLAVSSRLCNFPLYLLFYLLSYLLSYFISIYIYNSIYYTIKLVQGVLASEFGSLHRCFMRPGYCAKGKPESRVTAHARFAAPHQTSPKSIEIGASALDHFARGGGQHLSYLKCRSLPSLYLSTTQLATTLFKRSQRFTLLL